MDLATSYFIFPPLVGILIGSSTKVGKAGFKDIIHLNVEFAIH
jgi:hypothetical protein